jgi:hypothetical protein
VVIVDSEKNKEILESVHEFVKNVIEKLDNKTKVFNGKCVDVITWSTGNNSTLEDECVDDDLLKKYLKDKGYSEEDATGDEIFDAIDEYVDKVEKAGGIEVHSYN